MNHLEVITQKIYNIWIRWMSYTINNMNTTHFVNAARVVYICYTIDFIQTIQVKTCEWEYPMQ